MPDPGDLEGSVQNVRIQYVTELPGFPRQWCRGGRELGKWQQAAGEPLCPPHCIPRSFPQSQVAAQTLRPALSWARS